MYKIFPFFVAYCPKKIVLTAFQFPKERVCQVQSFAVLCKDWKNHSSVYTYLSFQRKSCSKDSCDNFLLYLCIIWDQRSKVFNSWQTFKGCPPRNMLGLFRFAEYLALWSMISVLSTDTFNPNQRQTSEKICTGSWRCSSFSKHRQVSSAKISSKRHYFSFGSWLVPQTTLLAA